jgi:trimeric autotransporter adhesin
MKKLYSKVLSAFLTANPGHIKAIKIFFIALLLSGASYNGYAQVTVTPATGGTSICTKTALDGTAPSCTTLGPIVVNETTNADYALGGDQFILNPPAGWQFCTAPAPVVTFLGGGNITAASLGAFTAGSLTINITAGATTLHDQVTITGLRVQALNTTSLPGNITAVSVTGVAGIVVGPGGTNFGSLALIPTPTPITTLTSFTMCTGNCQVLSSTPAGGVWTSSNPAVATVGAGTGLVCALTAGVTTITYTVGGCSVSQDITVNTTPPPFVVPNMCAWFDSFHVHDAVPGGVYSSTLVTVINLGGGDGEVYAHAPGVATIRYTVPSGCFYEQSVTINPLPAPIMAPPYEVCQGSTKLLTDASPGGTWTSTVPAIATIGSSTGLVTGIAPGGITHIKYTFPGTGCKTDTSFLVDPIPLPIMPPPYEVCVGSTKLLTDATPLGTWTSTNPAVAIIGTFSGLVTGVTAGTTTISYSLNTGCAATVLLTVDALPDSIHGPTQVCVNDSILLTDISPLGTWSGSNDTIATVNPTTGVVTGHVPGTVIISYSIMPGSCRVSYTITVNPIPAPIVGPDSVCVGSTIIETDATPSGTWSSSLPGVAFIDPVGFITGVTPGTSVISYTLSTGCKVKKTVTVNDVPSPIFGKNHVCVGDTIHLNDLTVGGLWSSLSPAIATVATDSGIVTGVTSGVTIIRYTIATGACYTNFPVTVNANPGAITGNPSVCQGDTTSQYNSLAGGTWVSGDTTVATINPVTGLVTGIAGGTVNISYTTTGGCFVTRSFVVNEKKPIFGPTQVCMGDTIILFDSTVGGTWGHIFPGFDNVIGTGGTGVSTALVIGILNGVDTITYTLSTGCIAKYTITINPITPIVAGITTVCVGSAIDLGDATPGGIWTSSDTFIAKIDSFSGHLTGMGPGNVLITYTMPTGCHASIVITVNPLPAAIVGPGQVCVSDTILLTDATLAGTWSSTDPSIATVNPATGKVTGVSAGIVAIKYTIGSGCFVIDSIIVNPKSPIFGPNQVCVASTITLVDTTAGGTWSLSNGSASISSTFDSSVTLLGVVAGVDTVYYTNGLTDCQSMYVITVNPLPSNITGPNEVCVGASVTFVDTPAVQPGPFGIWTSSAPGIAAVSSSFDSSAIITGIASGIAFITYTLPTGCLTTKAITVNPSPGAITGPNHVCLGRFISLGDPTPGGSWSSSNTGVATIDASGNIVTVSLGTTIIAYTLPIGGCSAVTVVTVTPIPLLTVNPTPAGMICKGGSQTLVASGAATPGGTPGTYTWTPSYGLSSTFGPVVIASPTITTTYTVTGTTQFGCDSTTTFTVVVDSALYHLKITGKDNICDGQCDTLYATGNPASLYDWHPHAGLSATIGDTVVACPNVTTKYTAIAIDYIGCKDSVSFTVNVNPIPKIVIDKNPVIVCRGLPTQVYVTTTNTDTSTTLFTWTPNLFISCDTCYNPIFTDTFNLVYRVIATSMYGCFDSLNVKVNVLDTNYNTINKDTNICIGTSAQLRAYSHSLVGNLDIPTYTWIPNFALNNPNIYNPLATPNVTTTYSVAIHENACFDDTLSVTVFVEPLPAITITPPSQNVVAGTPIQLQAIVTNVTVSTYAWTPNPTLSCDSCYNPVAIPVGPITYTVIVTSIYGCQSIDTVTFNIFCDKSQVFVPNTFTPNGDGVNDRFFISSKGITLIKRMAVYNRWGQLVFEALNIPPNQPGGGWDGTFKGVVCEPDVFIYVVDAICELGAPFKYTGDVSIVK